MQVLSVAGLTASRSATFPNGYSCSCNSQLRDTIATDLRLSASLKVMACHYSKPGEEYPCAGWLANQLGVGNNIAVRLAVMTGHLPIPEVEGEQHARFDDTLPAREAIR